MCNTICEDNRFELIAKYKQQLIEGTNIENSPDEMIVIDNILFRCWQMGWLNILEAQQEYKEDREWDYMAHTDIRD